MVVSLDSAWLILIRERVGAKRELTTLVNDFSRFIFERWYNRTRAIRWEFLARHTRKDWWAEHVSRPSDHLARAFHLSRRRSHTCNQTRKNFVSTSRSTSSTECNSLTGAAGRSSAALQPCPELYTWLNALTNKRTSFLSLSSLLYWPFGIISPPWIPPNWPAGYRSSFNDFILGLDHPLLGNDCHFVLYCLLGPLVRRSLSFTTNFSWLPAMTNTDSPFILRPSSASSQHPQHKDSNTDAKPRSNEKQRGTSFGTVLGESKIEGTLYWNPDAASSSLVCGSSVSTCHHPPTMTAGIDEFDRIMRYFEPLCRWSDFISATSATHPPWCTLLYYLFPGFCSLYI